MEEKKAPELNLEVFEMYDNYFDMSERKKLIAEMLKELRKQFNKTQEEIAGYIGIKKGTYSTYENGTREAPAEVIVRLSLLYGIPTDIILQQSRFNNDGKEAKKQLDYLNSQIDELWETISDRENELNPDFVKLMSAMTDAFTKMGDQISGLNEANTKKP